MIVLPEATESLGSPGFQLWKRSHCPVLDHLYTPSFKDSSPIHAAASLKLSTKEKVI